MISNIKKLFFRKRPRRLIRLVLGFLFAVYNGVFGLIFGSVWHMEISVYYVLLLVVKVIVSFHLNFSTKGKALTGVFVSTSIFLVLLNISLVLPIISMIRYERNVPFPLEAAIGIAAYTTYKVAITVISFIKTRKTSDLLICEEVTIRLIESIVAILTLQNTLIVVQNGTEDKGLLILSTISSLVGFLAIWYLIFRMIRYYFKVYKLKR